MTNNESAGNLSAAMDNLTVNTKPKIADRARYIPPHRKHLQGVTAPPPTPAVSTPIQIEPNKTLGAGLPKNPPPITEEASNSEQTATAVSAHGSEAQNKTESASASAATKTNVADSWEDETTSDSEAAKAQAASTTTTAERQATSTKPAPLAPHLRYRSAAPSPASPNRPERSATPPSRSDTPSSDRSDRRPETTNAVAHRLIAGALGVKMPRRTEEQRAYDKAVREQERKKRDQEREAKKKADEEAARAKAAIWDD